MITLLFRLHEEVLAQRALDRRLTEELMRFKNTISYLTRSVNLVPLLLCLTDVRFVCMQIVCVSVILQFLTFAISVLVIISQ